MKNKKTISELNKTKPFYSEIKSKNENKSVMKEKKKFDHNNFYRTLEAFSDCV